MPKKELRIAILPTGSFIVNLTDNGIINVIGGYEAPILDFLVKGLKMTYYLHLPNEATWGALTANGDWTGVVGMVHRQEVDISFSSMFMTEERRSVVRFGYPFTWDSVTFMTKLPASMSKRTAFFLPFSWQLWTYIVTTYLLYLIFLRLLPRNKICLLQKDILNTFAIFLRQTYSEDSKSVLNRITMFSWMLFSFFISYSYTVLLLSFLTLPLTEKGIRTTDELADAVSSGKFKCVVIKGSSLPASLSESNKEKDRFLGEFILKNKLFLDPKKVDLPRLVNQDKVALFASRRNLFFNYEEQYFISKDYFYNFPQSIIMQKSFSKRNLIDELLLRAAAAGIYQKSYIDYAFWQKLNRVKENKKSNVDDQLSMKDLGGIFIVLVAGNILSLIVFLVEWITFKLKLLQGMS